MSDHIDILPEIKSALEENRAVVALESTIISHGMPYPENLICARSCEDIIRESGAIPATVAILDGRIKIGLTGDQLEQLATSVDVISAQDATCRLQSLPGKTEQRLFPQR